MSRLIDDYLREVESSLRVDASRKRQIVDELRTHLAEKVEDVARADPTRGIPEIEQEVLREFGNPRDLALAYGPEGAAVLTNAAGDIVLRLGRAVGRGAVAVGRNTGKALKWVAISLAVLLVVALGVGAWAYTEVKPWLPSIIEGSEPAYQYQERCALAACDGEIVADTFYVPPESTSVRWDFNVYSVHLDDDRGRHVANGTVHVVVKDPDGNVRYDRNVTIGDEGALYQEATWAPVAGNWTVALDYDAFVGVVDVRAYAVEYPWTDR